MIEVLKYIIYILSTYSTFTMDSEPQLSTFSIFYISNALHLRALHYKPFICENYSRCVCVF